MPRIPKKQVRIGDREKERTIQGSLAEAEVGLTKVKWGVMGSAAEQRQVQLDPGAPTWLSGPNFTSLYGSALALASLTDTSSLQAYIYLQLNHVHERLRLRSFPGASHRRTSQGSPICCAWVTFLPHTLDPGEEAAHKPHRWRGE